MRDEWNKLGGVIDTALDMMKAAAPDAVTAAEAEAAVLRTAAGSLADICLAHNFTTDGLTRAVPTLGGHNPDYQIYGAPIDPARKYRIEGRFYGSERVGVGLYSLAPTGALELEAYKAFQRDSVDDRHGFCLDLAAAPGPTGLTISPQCRVLIVRVLHRDTFAAACKISLVEGASVSILRPDAGGCGAGLEQAGQRLLGTVGQFLEWSRLISMHPNRFITPPDSIAAAVKGDPDTNYCFGYYDLQEQEYLEVEIPQVDCSYWSLYACNHWLESIPGAGRHDLNAVACADGLVRLQVGPAAALAGDLSNPVDTQGRLRGVLIYRTLNENRVQLPIARLAGI